MTLGKLWFNLFCTLYFHIVENLIVTLLFEQPPREYFLMAFDIISTLNLKDFQSLLKTEKIFGSD